MTIQDTYAYLSTIVGYPQHVPDAPTTHTHRIGFVTCKTYMPPKVRKYEKGRPKLPGNHLNPSEQRILKMLKAAKEPVTAAMFEKKTKWTRNHCSIVLASLFKKGFATRYKVKQDNTRIYVYKLKEQSCQ